MTRRNVYFSADDDARLQELGIENLSAWIREKMQEDLAQRTPLTSLKDELAHRRAEVQALEAAFVERALRQEQALEVVERAAVQVRRTIGHVRGISVQTSILRWVQNHPLGQQVRRILPASLSDRDVVDVLERWPESKAGVMQLLEVAR